MGKQKNWLKIRRAAQRAQDAELLRLKAHHEALQRMRTLSASEDARLIIGWDGEGRPIYKQPPSGA